MTDSPATPSPSMNEEQDTLTELRRQARLEEHEFNSRVPLIGPLIAWFRGAWNSVATKWYVRPLMAQQTAFNLAIVDQLERVQGVAAATAAGMEAWLVDEDREQTRLIRQIAELEIRAKWLGDGSPAANVVSAGRPLRIAYFSPLPPAHSGIADYSAELLPHLARRAEVVLFSKDPQSQPVAGLPLQPIDAYPDLRDQFDIALYQMGNSSHHQVIYDLLIQYPGIVVLHDFTIHHFIRYFTRNEGQWTGYGRELAYALGNEGWQLERDIQSGKALPPLYAEPLNEHLIDISLGLLVHSEYAAAGVRRRRPELPLAVIPALIEPRDGQSLRSSLGIPADAVLFGSFGQITAEKQPELSLRALQRVMESQPEARFLFVGEALPDIADTFEAMIASLGLAGHVHWVGHVAGLDEFVDWIHTADVVINLRYPTAGETSAVALRAMATGRPLIVFDHGWYSEIPDANALKVKALDEEELAAAMSRLGNSPGLRSRMGEAGRAYAREFCHPDRVAATYVTFIQQTLEKIVSIAA